MTPFGWLTKHLRGRKRQAMDRTEKILEIAPWKGPVYAVGDVHGCARLFRSLEALVLADAASQAGTPTIVLLGDMIDRGPQSADLLDHLLAPPPQGVQRLCLMGNHEDMMLAFLAAPRENLDWLDHGGTETLASYGLMLDRPAASRLSDRQLGQALAAHIPQRHLDFLSGLLFGLQLGKHLLVHAGIDADCPLSAQPRSVLLWGREAPLPRGMTLVHGHFIVDAPMIWANGIAIDTGAFATGRLTALRLIPGEPPAVLTTGQDAGFRPLTTDQR